MFRVCIFSKRCRLFCKWSCRNCGEAGDTSVDRWTYDCGNGNKPSGSCRITSGLKGNAGITIGNVVGSNIMNVFVILGITAVITNVAIQKSTLYYEIPFMILVTLLMIFFGMTRQAVSFVEGVIFWILFLYRISCLSFCYVKKE